MRDRESVEIIDARSLSRGALQEKTAESPISFFRASSRIMLFYSPSTCILMRPDACLPCFLPCFVESNLGNYPTVCVHPFMLVPSPAALFEMEEVGARSESVVNSSLFSSLVLELGDFPLAVCAFSQIIEVSETPDVGRAYKH